MFAASNIVTKYITIVDGKQCSGSSTEHHFKLRRLFENAKKLVISFSLTSSYGSQPHLHLNPPPLTLLLSILSSSFIFSFRIVCIITVQTLPTILLRTGWNKNANNHKQIRKLEKINYWNWSEILFFKTNGPFPVSFYVYCRLFNTSQFKLIKGCMACLGFEPGAAGWKVQTNPPSSPIWNIVRVKILNSVKS